MTTLAGYVERCWEKLIRFGWGNLKEYDNLVAPVLGATVIKSVLNVG